MDEKEIEFFEKGIQHHLGEIKKLQEEIKKVRLVIFAFREALKNKSKKYI